MTSTDHARMAVVVGVSGACRSVSPTRRERDTTTRRPTGMGALEYWFGTGDGTTHTWFSEADVALTGDGLDAVALDFDGDGLLDDAMWDRDRNGVVDTAVLDRDTTPRHYADPSERGVWDLAVDPNPPGPQVEWTDRDGRIQHAPAGGTPIDYDGDGHASDAILDTDHDGHADAVLIAGANQGYRAVYPTPDLGALDTDGDGVLDAITTDPPSRAWLWSPQTP